MLSTNQCLMQKYYFAFLFLITMSAFGQDFTSGYSTKSTEKSSFKLYPNPAVNGVVYITTTNNNNKEIMIYDVFGEIVLTNNITSNTLNISKLKSGVYMLQLTENNKTMTRKLVVK